MGECLVIRSGSGVDTSIANATFDTIVSGYSCYVNDELVIGSIPINTINDKLSSDDSYNIQYGYYDDKNLISVSTLKEETVGTAVSSDLLINNNGWSNGIYIDGNIPNIETVLQTMSANESYTIPRGWHNGSGKVTQTLSTQKTLSVTPSESDQIVCDVGKWTTGDLIVIGDTNFIQTNIKNGVTIFGLIGTYSDWVDDTAPINVVASVSGGSTSVHASSRTSPVTVTCMAVTPNTNISKFKTMTVSVTCGGYPVGGSDYWEWSYAQMLLYNGYVICEAMPASKNSGFSKSGTVTVDVVSTPFSISLRARASNSNGTCSIIVNK